jgi:hypothetical protein
MTKWEIDFRVKFGTLWMNNVDGKSKVTCTEDVLNFFAPLIPTWKDAVKEPPERDGTYMTNLGYKEFVDGKWKYLYQTPKFWLSVSIPPIPSDKETK